MDIDALFTMIQTNQQVRLVLQRYLWGMRKLKEYFFVTCLLYGVIFILYMLCRGFMEMIRKIHFHYLFFYYMYRIRRWGYAVLVRIRRAITRRLVKQDEEEEFLGVPEDAEYRQYLRANNVRHTEVQYRFWVIMRDANFLT